MTNKSIQYSQCWEDPAILLEALNVNSKDSVLSITSGGDNTLMLLASRPKRIVSLDSNATQNYLLELKRVALKALDSKELLCFLGVYDSDSREKLFQNIEKFLSKEARTWWGEHPSSIRGGIIHCGKFEIFLNVFRKYVLPLIHTRKTIAGLLSCVSVSEQGHYYNTKWNTLRWKLYFKLASSRFILKCFARHKGSFSYTSAKNAIADIYLKRLEHHLNTVPVYKNYFLQYCLMGGYGDVPPDYLNVSTVKKINSSTTKLEIVTDDILHFLQEEKSQSFSKYNLSDVFDSVSTADSVLLWHEILRTAQDNARVMYWENLVERRIPKNIEKYAKRETKLEKKLSKKDRVFFYKGVRVYKIKK